VVAVTGGPGASLATPSGCRHFRRAEARFAVSRFRRVSRATAQLLVLVGPWRPRVPGARVGRAETLPAPRAAVPLVHDSDHRRPGCASLRKNVAHLVRPTAGSAFPPHHWCPSAPDLAIRRFSVSGLAAEPRPATEATVRHPRQPPARAGVCRPRSGSAEAAPSWGHPIMARATVDRGIRRSAVDVDHAAKTVLHSHRASFTRATGRIRRHACTDRVFSALPHSGPKSVARSDAETCSTLGDRLIFRAFLPSRVRCTRTGVYAVQGPVLSWVFNLSRASPSSPWAGATTSPPLTGLAWGPAPLRERFPSTGTTGVPVGCLSECHRAMRLVDLSRDQQTLMRSRASSFNHATWRSGAPGS
jgi:hypothetical protein